MIYILILSINSISILFFDIVIQIRCDDVGASTRRGIITLVPLIS